MCVSTCQVDFVLRELSCLIFYYGGVDFLEFGKLLSSEKNCSAFLTTTWAEGRILKVELLTSLPRSELLIGQTFGLAYSSHRQETIRLSLLCAHLFYCL